MTKFYLYIFAINLGLLFNNSRIVYFFQLFVAALIAWVNARNADYDNYLYTYQSINQGGEYYQFFENYEYGYRLAAELFNYLDFDYHGFRLVLIVVALVNLNYIYLKSESKSYLFSIFLIFSFLLEVVQIRNFVAMSFVLSGMTWYLTKAVPKSSDKIKLLLILLVGASFQNVALFYFVIAVVYFLKNFISKLKYLIGVFLFLVFYFQREQIAGAFSSFAYLVYFDTLTSLPTSIFFTAIILLLGSLLWMARNNLLFLHSIELFVFVFYSTSFLVFALTYFNVEFFRFFRNIMPMLGILLLHSKANSLALKKSIILLVSILLFYFFIYYASYDGVLEPVLF